jgi:hypothetical protein
MLRIKMKGRERKDIFINVITLKVMSKAIASRIGIRKDKAEQIAGFIMDIFGYDNRIIDNILKPEDRQLLYMLEAEGLIVTGREEEKLYDGREWLTHYWELSKGNILKYAENGIKKRKNILTSKIKTEGSKRRNIYNTLPDDMWTARKNYGRKSTHF